ncbi:uncharacterized protein BX664DRAFT_344417 [Halteromyces radiatus]|uniref:uncharacterized protein n=1 Tax=Halteromyces radiatus TaxID=101107 RepID=UPI00221E3900|nr:uncharacterized protein BX664DRAFT_344417 [Halteromyces radiatus]KAI8076335.1 hypothetical protein BX664DRAFT_344417 [Halteromyces radiatus]
MSIIHQCLFLFSYIHMLSWLHRWVFCTTSKSNVIITVGSERNKGLPHVDIRQFQIIKKDSCIVLRITLHYQSLI